MIKGIGTDIIEVSRIQKAVERWGNHFINHVYCQEEIDYCFRYKYPYEHFAGRFAAKEAVIKALADVREFEWKDIKILNHESGKPYCVLNKTQFNGTILITISHTKHYATAFAIIAS